MILVFTLRGCSSVGRALPCQGRCREFESRHPLSPARSSRATARHGPQLALVLRVQITQRAKASRRSSASAERRRTPAIMHYVYIIESVSIPGHFYIGYTDNLRERVRKHQADVSSHAAKYRPWKLKSYVALETKEKALRFERYLKSGSGRAFCRRHFD